VVAGTCRVRTAVSPHRNRISGGRYGHVRSARISRQRPVGHTTDLSATSHSAECHLGDLPSPSNPQAVSPSLPYGGRRTAGGWWVPTSRNALQGSTPLVPLSWRRLLPAKGTRRQRRRGWKKGKKERREEGKRERRKEGRKERRKEGRKERKGGGLKKEKKRKKERKKERKKGERERSQTCAPAGFAIIHMCASLCVCSSAAFFRASGSRSREHRLPHRPLGPFVGCRRFAHPKRCDPTSDAPSALAVTLRPLPFEPRRPSVRQSVRPPVRPSPPCLAASPPRPSPLAQFGRAINLARWLSRLRVHVHHLCCATCHLAASREHGWLAGWLAG